VRPPLLVLSRCGAHRHNINPDSISYIEIAQSAREDGWKSYVNGYWSPLYPFLLTNAFRIFDPGTLWESTVVIFANLAIYLADLACFEWFFRELILLRDASDRPAERGFPISSRTLWICGYVFFLWTGQFWVTPGWVFAGFVRRRIGLPGDSSAHSYSSRPGKLGDVCVFWSGYLGLGTWQKRRCFHWPLSF